MNIQQSITESRNVREQAAVAEGGPRGNRATQSGVSPPLGSTIDDPRIRLLTPILKRARTSDHWVVPPGGSPSHKRAPITDARLDGHLNGGHRVGACPIERGASTTRLALFDLDSHKGEVSWPAMQATARSLIDAAAARSLRASAVRSSGGHGIHLIFMWNDPQDARSVRRLLGQVLDECGLKNGTCGVRHYEVEIFPKQDSVPADGWGNMFVLPFAGKSVALDPVTLEEIDAGAVKLRGSDPVPVVEPEPVRAPSSIEVPPEVAEVREALAAIDPNDFDYEGWLKILFAVHAATDGSEEGLSLILDWSSRFDRFDTEASAAETDKQWRFARSNKEGGITVGTLFAEAGKRGYVPLSRRPSAEGLQPLDENGEPLDVGAVKDRLLDVFTFGEQTDADCVTFHALPGEAQVEIMQIADLCATEEAMKTVRDAIERARGSAARAPVAVPEMTRTTRGKIEASYTNVYAACERPDVAGVSIGYDEFLGEVVISHDEGENWVAMSDADYVGIQKRLERVGFTRVAKEVLRDVVGAVAHAGNRFDTAKLWLDRLQWDGVLRIERFLSTYLGAEDTPYTRAVARYQWTAMAARVLDPGCKADMAPVWVGAQGAGKSTVARALVPDATFFKELSFSERDADLSRKMRGLLVGELSELRGLATRELEAVKAWITQQHEHWTPKFKEFGTTFARRCIFIGTTNQQQFLADETGERRWLPVQVGKCNPGAVARDREQLWAEAREMYLREGIAYHDAENLAREEHGRYKVHDSWADAIHRWLDEEPRTLSGEAQEPGRRRDRPFTTGDVMSGALSIGPAGQRQAEQQRVAKILRASGFECDKTQSRVGADRVRYWRAVR